MISLFDDDSSGTLNLEEYFNLAIYLRELEFLYDERKVDGEEGGVKEWRAYLVGCLGEKLSREQEVVKVFEKLAGLGSLFTFEAFAKGVILVWTSKNLQKKVFFFLNTHNIFVLFLKYL